MNNSTFPNRYPYPPLIRNRINYDKCNANGESRLIFTVKAPSILNYLYIYDVRDVFRSGTLGKNKIKSERIRKRLPDPSGDGLIYSDFFSSPLRGGEERRVQSPLQFSPLSSFSAIDFPFFFNFLLLFDSHLRLRRKELSHRVLKYGESSTPRSRPFIKKTTAFHAQRFFPSIYIHTSRNPLSGVHFRSGTPL